jgi:hypothetical protein
VKGTVIGLQFALGMHGFGRAKALAEKGFTSDGRSDLGGGEARDVDRR